METRTETPSRRPSRTRRRLKPEVAARMAHASRRGVAELYEKPVEQLTPGEMARMKSAFFSGE